MKHTIITALSAITAIAFGVNAQAKDLTHKATLEQVAMYGGEEYDEGEIVASKDGSALKFVFNGEPIEDKHKKVIQIYCQVWDLQPGKYHLIIEMKSGGDALKFPICLDGKAKSDEYETVKLADYMVPQLTAEWQKVKLPVEISEPMLHGHFIMRVGELAKGSELLLKPKLTFSPVD